MGRRVARRGDREERAVPENVQDMVEGRHGFSVAKINLVQGAAAEVIARRPLARAEHGRNAAVEIREPRCVVLVQVREVDLLRRHAASAHLRGHVLTWALSGLDPDRGQQLSERSTVVAAAVRERPRQACVDKEVAMTRVMNEVR